LTSNTQPHSTTASMQMSNDVNLQSTEFDPCR
jgi:hypothetical protein